MEFNEIKPWAEKNIKEFNLRNVFLAIVEIIYNNTDDRIESIETFYKWFLTKWEECGEIVSEHVSEFDMRVFNCSIARQLRLFFNIHVKKVFNIKRDLLDCITHLPFGNYSVDINNEKYLIWFPLHHLRIREDVIKEMCKK